MRDIIIDGYSATAEAVGYDVVIKIPFLCKGEAGEVIEELADEYKSIEKKVA